MSNPVPPHKPALRKVKVRLSGENIRALPARAWKTAIGAKKVLLEMKKTADDFVRNENVEAGAAPSLTQNGQIGFPRPDLFRVLFRHRARNLPNVAQIMNHPRCEQLA